MPLTQRYVYATDNPAALDAYRRARADRHEFGTRLLADAAELGHNVGPLSRKTVDGGEEIVGLKPDGSAVAPLGWHFVERGKRLAPRTGHLGNKARRWLADHQPPAGTNPLQVLSVHGLPGVSRIETGGQFADFRPVLFEWDGRLWACYRGEPDWVTWPQAPLADCLIALARAGNAPYAIAN
jgi:hypothetical protein